MAKSSGTSLSWAFYDFANTIFSAVVLTAYFPLYMNELAPDKPWYLGTATTFSMLLAGAAVPFLGALSDATGRTKNYLFKTTAACIFFLFFLSIFKSPGPLIAAFTVSCFFYHASLVFYHSLLPAAAPPEKQGFVSGLGTGLGYLGVVMALPIANQAEHLWGKPVVFTVAGILFFVFSIPIFLFVPERKVATPRSFKWGLWWEEWRHAHRTIMGLPSRPALMYFFIGNFLVLEALNGTIFWFAVYAREVFHPSSQEIIYLLMGVNASAFLTGLICGVLTDKLKSSTLLVIAAAALALNLIALVLMPSFAAFTAVCLTLGAFSISGIWTAGRKRVVELAPQEDLGAYFGIYNLTTKFSIISNLLFSVAAGKFGFRPALLALTIPAMASLFFLKKSAAPRLTALALVLCLGFSGSVMAAEETAVRVIWDNEKLKKATLDDYPRTGDEVSLLKSSKDEEVMFMKEVLPPINGRPAMRLPETRHILTQKFYAEGKVVGSSAETGENGEGLLVSMTVDQQKYPGGKPDVEVSAKISKEGKLEIEAYPLTQDGLRESKSAEPSGTPA